MSLNLSDRYSEFVATLASPNSTASYKDKLLTAALGLAGESGECLELVNDYVWNNNDLQKDKLIDELGDVLWYFMFALNSLERRMADVTNFDYEYYHVSTYAQQYLSFEEFLTQQTIELQIQSSKFADLVKKEVYHTKAYPVAKFLEKLHLIINTINHICGCLELSVGKVIRLNIKKLESRYPSGKFSVEDFMKKENAKDPE